MSPIYDDSFSVNFTRFVPLQGAKAGDQKGFFFEETGGSLLTF
jgi:hypothetical protein